jgi:dystonin
MNDGKKFKERFDITVIVANKQSKLLSIAYDELKKFTNEKSAFENWLEKALADLEDLEARISQITDFEKNTEVIKSFLNEVMTHGADLKFLRMTAQKYTEISKVCLSINLRDPASAVPETNSREFKR